MRLALLCCLMALAGSALADEAPAALPDASAETRTVPQGYAFDQPELLVDQYLWGIAHGARLLAQACVRHGNLSAAEAWVEWMEREAAQIRALTATLGRHYFQQDDVPLDALAMALGLSQSLDLSAEETEPACATLAEALAQPRYDLARRREALMKEVAGE